MMVGLVGLSSCSKENILQDDRSNGNIKQLNASIAGSGTKVAMTDGVGVTSFTWKSGDRIAFYPLIGTSSTAVFVDPIYFQLEQASAGTASGSFSAVSTGLTAGVKYFGAHVGGLTKLSYQANLMRLVFSVPSSIQQSSADPSVADRFKNIEDSECFYAGIFTATDPATPMTFSHKMSVIRLAIKSEEAANVKSVRIQAPGQYFVTEAILSNLGAFTYNTTDNLSVSLTQAYALPGDNSTVADVRMLCWWNPAIASVSGNYTVTVTTTDGKSATTTYPATKLWTEGKVYSVPVSVSGFTAASMKSFSDLSAETAGTINGAWKIRGVVISPNKNENLNYYREDGTYWYSDTNDKTVYIQDENGRGIRLLTATTEDNVFEQGQTVDLMINGLTLSKDAVAPTAVTLSGVTRGHISAISSLIPMPAPKEKTIAQLTDDDVYSLVIIKTVEFALKDGCLSNMNEGYTFRVGASTTLLQDGEGNALSLITNTNVPYRRLLTQNKGANTAEEWFVRRFNVAANDGELPKGSGDVSGILVSDTYVRLPNLTKYSLRHMSAADIAISTDPATRFSQDICGFVDLVQFPKTTNANRWWKMPLGGALSHSKVASGSKIFSGSSGGTAVFYTNKHHSAIGQVNINDNNLKGQKDSSGLGCHGANNWTSSTPEYLILKFPSKNINASGLTISISGFEGYTGCNYWAVEYSSAWSPMATWNRIGEFTLPNLMSFSNGAIFPILQSPSNDMVCYKIPAAVTQVDTTYIRIIPRDKNGFTDAGVPTTTGLTGASYWGAIVIKNNK